MSSIRNDKTLVTLKDEYSKFLAYLELIVKEVRPKSTISITKLGYYKKQLNKITSLDEDEQHKLIEIINKYTNLNCLLDGSVDINFKRSDLFKMIEGQFTLDDKDQEYNDTFLELSMALRFAKSANVASIINMHTDCDVIVSDEIAIECKYIHSSKQIEKNISCALKQIDNRVTSRLAKYGFIALDLSNIIDRGKINNFAQMLYEDFYHGHKRLKDTDDAILKSILDDANFSGILGQYLAHNVEVEFYEKIFRFPVKEKMNINTKAIIFQATTSFSFSNITTTVPVPFRVMPYLINPKLGDKEKGIVANEIHALCNGI